MNQFQKLWVKFAPRPEGEGDPANVRAANHVSRKATGDFLDKQDKPIAGEAVHFGFGAVLGGLYGLAAEYRPEVTAGFGTGFGTAAMLAFDEGAVPAVGLTQPPTEFGAGDAPLLVRVAFGVRGGDRGNAADASALLPVPELDAAQLAGRGLRQGVDELDFARIFVGRNRCP